MATRPDVITAAPADLTGAGPPEQPPDVTPQPRRKVGALFPLLGLGGVLALWVLVDAVFDLPSTVFAGPGQVWRTGVEMVEQGQLPAYLSRSLRTLGLCSVIVTVIGVPVGIAIGLSQFISQSVDHTLRFMRNVSAIALIPLFIVWFGIGPEAVYAVVLYSMFIPIIYNSSDGVRAVPRRYGMVVKTLGGSWWHEVKDAYLPGALPGVLVGFKLAISYGWRAAVGAELLLGVEGMGGLLASGRTAGRIDQIILAMIVIGLTFVVIDNLILRNLEVLTSRRWSVK